MHQAHFLRESSLVHLNNLESPLYQPCSAHHGQSSQQLSSGSSGCTQQGSTDRRQVKASTGIVGVEPLERPIETLRGQYEGILSTLKQLPESSVYRQSAEALARHKLDVVNKAGDNVKIIEEELGIPAVVSLEAKSENNLILKLLEWKP